MREKNDPRTLHPPPSTLHGRTEESAHPSAPGDYDLLKPFMSGERHRRLDEVLAARTARLVLVAENLYDPHNLSAILRSADAFGIQRVFLTGEAPSELNPLVSLGAERWLSVERVPDARGCIEGLKASGFTVAAAALADGAVDPREWEPPGPVALAMGNEHAGLSPLFLEGADVVLRIPMAGFVRSLNVSVAAGVLLWTLMGKEALKARGLPPEDEESLRTRWARQSVEHSEAILKRLRGE
jgi:tRNA (guanosine-2'-O-)-methyltransferase